MQSLQLLIPMYQVDAWLYRCINRNMIIHSYFRVKGIDTSKLNHPIYSENATDNKPFNVTYNLFYQPTKYK